MLSKVAERVYWTARYLERVESTARIVSIYDKLLFDMPRTVKLSWYNLIVINSLEEDYNERYSVKDERNVVKFLLCDESNTSSVASSLKFMRENIRTTRDVVLEETWELVNELSLYVQDNLKTGINRSQRHEFLDTIIKGCQQILGLLYGNMPHDAAWDFLRLGRNLERADMTTRNLDAGIAEILDLEEDDTSINSRQIILGNVLRSLNADMSYRRNIRAAVSSRAVLAYLIEDEEFPRSITHCMNALIDSCEDLPRSETVVKKLTKIRKDVLKNIDYDQPGEDWRQCMNDIQISLGNIHTIISENWFPKIPEQYQQQS